MIDRCTPQLGSNISAQIDCTSGGSADQFIDADQCRYARQHLLHIHTVIISTRTEASRFFFFYSDYTFFEFEEKFAINAAKSC